MADSSGSSLSSIASDDISDHDDTKQTLLSPSGHHANNANASGASASASANVRPSKKRRTGVASWDRNTTPVSASFQDEIPPASPSASISSDTSGEISNSPNTLALLGGTQEDDYSGQGNDQVTTCRWEGCDAGVLGNMDNLVNHIHNEHIGSRQKKYSCEWADCNRKGQTHASGYALRAHMRSHTREKPFYCSLPECDRSFTRSDALTKHMRTVHETEALRPLDPNLKANASSLPLLGGPAGGSGSALPASKLQRIKLKLSQPPKDDADRDSEPGANDDPSATTAAGYLPEIDFDLPEYAPEVGFDEHELALRPRDLYRLLRRQIFWAERESERLREEWDFTRPKRKQAWLEKEAVFERWLNDEMEFSAAYNQIKREREAQEAKEEEEDESSQQPPPITVTNGSKTHADQDQDEDQDLDQLQHRQQRNPSQSELVDLEVQRWAREFQEKQQSARQASVAKSNSADSKPGIIPRPAGDV